MQRTQRQVLIATILAVLVCAGAAALLWRITSPTPTAPTGALPAPTGALPAPASADALLADLTKYSVQRWSGDTTSPPASLNRPAKGVYLAARENGALLTQAWGHGLSIRDGLKEAIAALGDDARAATHLELFIAEREEPASDELLSNIHRGVFGIAMEHAGERTYYSPTEVLASNRSHRKLLGLSSLDGLPTENTYWRLVGSQVRIDLRGQVGEYMERGNRTIRLSEVTLASVTTFSRLLTEWMRNSLHDDGRMTYLYWPSQGREAPNRNNLIRQFMATIALGRVAVRTQDKEQGERVAGNLEYNLRTFYELEGNLGLVVHDEKVKLGALALAALAIIEHPERARWKRQEEALLRTIDSLWQENGRFRTFHRPASREDNQNFYPGEALLLWATLLSKAEAPALHARFMKSFSYYQDWHLDSTVAGRRNPAFVPWHTQAYFLVWKQSHDEVLRDAIFEMNDWLLGIQERETARYKDTRGRFYAADGVYGPPHASATGVYLEGLVDAYQLASEVGDTRRAKKYSEAIQRGLRSLMQLQFSDDTDMFYVSQKERVRGGLRTTVYDNQIRCDNVQHTLMAVLKIIDSGLLPAVQER